VPGLPSVAWGGVSIPGDSSHVLVVLWLCLTGNPMGRCVFLAGVEICTSQ
jgi:hypothetical protein